MPGECGIDQGQSADAPEIHQQDENALRQDSQLRRQPQRQAHRTGGGRCFIETGTEGKLLRCADGRRARKGQPQIQQQNGGGVADGGVFQSAVEELRILPPAEGGNGVLYYDDEKVTDFCKKANRAGLQIEMHAIGDKAFDQACRALKAALDDYPRENHRHGIIHDCLPTEEGIRICKAYGIQMPVQSAFINWKQEPDEYLSSILGEDRLAKLNPIRTFRDNNIVVSFGSDAPCTSPDPIVWMDKAVNNPNEGEAVPVQDALRMCTYNGSYTTFDEQERGSREAGKIADMVILSANPYTIEKSEIGKLKVEQLLLGGKPYESCQCGLGKTVLKGLRSKAKA